MFLNNKIDLIYTINDQMQENVLYYYTHLLNTLIVDHINPIMCFLWAL